MFRMNELVLEFLALRGYDKSLKHVPRNAQAKRSLVKFNAAEDIAHFSEHQKVPFT